VYAPLRTTFLSLQIHYCNSYNWCNSYFMRSNKCTTCISHFCMHHGVLFFLVFKATTVIHIIDVIHTSCVRTNVRLAGVTFVCTIAIYILCVQIHMYRYICMHIYIYKYVYMYVYVYIYIYICMYTCKYIFKKHVSWTRDGAHASDYFLKTQYSNLKKTTSVVNYYCN